MLGLKTPQPDLLGPVGLPKTDWTLTTAEAGSPGQIDLNSSVFFYHDKKKNSLIRSFSVVAVGEIQDI